MRRPLGVLACLVGAAALSAPVATANAATVPQSACRVSVAKPRLTEDGKIKATAALRGCYRPGLVRVRILRAVPGKDRVVKSGSDRGRKARVTVAMPCAPGTYYAVATDYRGYVGKTRALRVKNCDLAATPVPTASYTATQAPGPVPTRTVTQAPTRPAPTRTVTQPPAPVPTPTRTVTQPPAPVPTPTRTVTQRPAPVPTPTRTVTQAPRPTPTVTSTGGTGGTVGTAEENEVLRITNAERAKGGCQPLRHDAQLHQAAAGHSADMAAKGYFSHTSKDGRSFTDRIRQAGFTGGRGWAENIARGQTTPADVMTTWMNSTGHRTNIMNCSYNLIGVGAVKDARGQIYWTQVFAAR